METRTFGAICGGWMKWHDAWTHTQGNNTVLARLQVLTALLLKIPFFSGLMKCWVCSSQCFQVSSTSLSRGPTGVHFSGIAWSWRWMNYMILWNVSIYQLTWCKIPKDLNLELLFCSYTYQNSFPNYKIRFSITVSSSKWSDTITLQYHHSSTQHFLPDCRSYH